MQQHEVVGEGMKATESCVVVAIRDRNRGTVEWMFKI